MATKKSTPAKRARARRDPTISIPPPRPAGSRTSSVRNLALRAGGRAYPISAAIEGDTPWSQGMDQTGTFQLPIRDPHGRLPQILATEANLQEKGVTVVLDGIVYVVSGVDYDGAGLYTLTVEDEVSWQLKQFTSYRSASRARTTRFGFIQGFVDEASRPPYDRMRSFIPEIDDKQPIKKAKRTTR
jgi:hypothetical protein